MSSFPGDVGGMLANINRWRGQLGLAAFTTEMLNQQTADLNLSSGKGTVVDFSGTDVKSGKPARLVGVVVPREGETWFYKMMGDPVVSDTEKPAFLKFVQSVKYSHGN